MATYSRRSRVPLPEVFARNLIAWSLFRGLWRHQVPRPPATHVASPFISIMSGSDPMRRAESAVSLRRRGFCLMCLKFLRCVRFPPARRMNAAHRGRKQRARFLRATITFQADPTRGSARPVGCFLHVISRTVEGSYTAPEEPLGAASECVGWDVSLSMLPFNQHLFPGRCDDSTMKELSSRVDFLFPLEIQSGMCCLLDNIYYRI